MKGLIIRVAIITLNMVATQAFSQFNKSLLWPLNDDGSHFLQATVLAQIQARYQDLNPGSTLYGDPVSHRSDIGLRRFRMQLYGQLTNRIFFYTQLGENNFNSLADRKLGLFVHDLCVEYAPAPGLLSIGAGLTGWSGPDRFASPSAGAIAGLDAPLFEQSTNDVTDQFLRKLSIYAKGKLGRLDYRLVVSDPLVFQKSPAYNPNLSVNANFSSKPAHKSWSAYLQYQFLDKESNLAPYMAGTYLGKKKVFNLGLGVLYQPNAMWYQGPTSTDTLFAPLLHLAADLFYDAPVGENGQAIHVYLNFTHSDFGPNYIRNLAVMNPVNGNSRSDILNGSGNGYPAYGTGNVWYGQIAYKLKNNLLGKASLMPYAGIQLAWYDRLNDPMLFTDTGVNVLLQGHNAKFTLAWQNRPVFNSTGDQLERKSGWILQYQVFIN